MEPPQHSMLDRALLVLVLFAFSLSPFVPEAWSAIPLAITVAATSMGLARRSALIVPLGVVASVALALMIVPALRPLWPLPLVAGIAAHLALWRVPWLRGTYAFARRGRIDARVVAAALAFVVAASVALVAWVALTHPDLSDLFERVPSSVPLAAIVAGAFLFSVLNAFAEEWVYRGLALDGLDAALGRGVLALLLSSLAFGLLHIEGFPRGAIGVGLATIYGLMMGIVRRLSSGIVAPIAAHVFADLTIVALLVALARG